MDHTVELAAQKAGAETLGGEGRRLLEWFEGEGEAGPGGLVGQWKSCMHRVSPVDFELALCSRCPPLPALSQSHRGRARGRQARK